MTDASGRAAALLLTPGNVADISMAAHLLAATPAPRPLIADKGCDANAFRSGLSGQQTEAVIPSTASRNIPIPHNREAYRRRNKIERAFCSIKDYRRIATRYDKLARNFLSAVALDAGGRHGSCGLADGELFLPAQVLHVEVAVALEPVLAGLDKPSEQQAVKKTFIRRPAAPERRNPLREA